MLNYQIGEHEKCSRNVTSINIVIFSFGLHEILLFIRMILNVKSETVHLHKENAAFCRVKVCGAFRLFIFWISHFTPQGSSVLFRFFDTFDRWLAFNLFSFFCVNMQISKKKKPKISDVEEVLLLVHLDGFNFRATNSKINKKTVLIRREILKNLPIPVWRAIQNIYSIFFHSLSLNIPFYWIHFLLSVRTSQFVISLFDFYTTHIRSEFHFIWWANWPLAYHNWSVIKCL